MKGVDDALMGKINFTPDEEEIIQAGVVQHFKNMRAAEIKAEIDRRIASMSPNEIDCRLTKKDIPVEC